MPAFEQSDWYDHPHYYDIVFDGDTSREADFLEDVFAEHGHGGRQRRVLEPACGSGRLLAEFARRGWKATGFDLNERMLAYARTRPVRAGAPGLRVFPARLESFPPCGPVDLAHCILSTFKYVLTGKGAASHLRLVARSLVRGGLYVLGIHLTDYRRRTTDREQWTGEKDGVRVASDTWTSPADRKSRRERLRNRMVVHEPGPQGRPRVRRIETHWECRTYDARQLRALIGRAPELEIVACYDFNHDILLRRGFDDEKEDLVVVLRKR